MSLRDFILRCMPKAMREAAERDSRTWFATCPHCAKQTSVWDLGGIRYRAAGRPRSGFRCRACGRFGWHPIRRL